MAEIAKYDQKIDGKWYRVGDFLPSDKPAEEPKQETEKPKKVSRKKG